MDKVILKEFDSHYELDLSGVSNQSKEKINGFISVTRLPSLKKLIVKKRDMDYFIEEADINGIEITVQEKRNPLIDVSRDINKANQDQLPPIDEIQNKEKKTIHIKKLKTFAEVRFEYHAGIVDLIKSIPDTFFKYNIKKWFMPIVHIEEFVQKVKDIKTGHNCITE